MNVSTLEHIFAFGGTGTWKKNIDSRFDKNLRVEPTQVNSSSDGDTKRWSGWSMTRGEVLAGLDPSDFMVVKKESKSSSKNSPRKSTTSRARGVFPCERCGRSYVRKDSLQRHLQWECGKEPTFQCPFCPQRCKRKAHQIRHIRRQHSDMISLVDPKDHAGIVEAISE
ncbi:hypothetical protein ANN_25154 [Periplaneta americana]|uniref:C2H2-type domain-containing protein n=1 Tax=Periplaneta americana TaxID=6978 RepID=A0ABQ8S141_PERAM|nr:hypothetical protein ANN_25154 [Periplaneta americana]